MSATIEKIEFVQFHKPTLVSGNYEIEVDHKFKVKDEAEETFTASQKFSVQGNRFELSPTDIHSVYPPLGSFGEYSKVLPHLILNRSSLPWEREPNINQAPESSASWLALLLFKEDEAPKPQVKQLDDLTGVILEPGQSGADKVTVIEVEKTLLDTILPKFEDLEYLSHIRLSKDSANNIIGGEKATLICNRLPQPGTRSIVHLVSLENKYPAITESQDLSQTLVSLYHWSFTSEDESKGDFKSILLDLNVEALRLPDAFVKEGEGDPKEDAILFMQKGFVPLRHQMRMGQKTVSLYHSPLAPAQISWPAPGLPARSADELLHYYNNYGLFDVSYASAWELGRKLALQDQKFATTLVNWKKELLLKQKKGEQWQDWTYIMPTGSIDTSTENLLAKAQDILLHDDIENDHDQFGIPHSIESFFDQLRLLKGVPFDYLVPHPEMLPSESIRFFRIDPVWMDCLLDGAFSLGEDALRSDKNTNSNTIHEHKEVITGFLLRSSLISGWPGMLINGFSAIPQGSTESDAVEQPTLSIIRQEKITEEILLVFFEGDIQALDFSLAPDTIHFGLDVDNDTQEDEDGDSNDPTTGKFWQILRDKDGAEQSGNDNMILKTIPFHVPNENLVININELAEAMKPLLEANDPTFDPNDFNSAQFALQMIEGADTVRISRS